jgi:inner membrane protein
VASLGHIAVGMAAARIHGTAAETRRSWLNAVVLWSMLSFLPDADVIGFGFGVNYGDEWGHRGATHSFAFSLALGVAIGVTALMFRRPAVRTGITAGVVLASHALLDTLTNGGLGCALLWPFDNTRYFAPWNPIPVAPIGLSFFSTYGLFVATAELVLFAPLLWFALSPATVAGAGTRHRRTGVRALMMSVWLAGVWLLTSRDPVRERVVSVALRDDTEYTPDFSEQALRAVDMGQTVQDVHARLGPPFYELLVYPDGPDACVTVRVEDDMVASAQPPDACEQRGVAPATSLAALRRALGPPEETCWVYSRSPNRRYFRARAVCFAGDRVNSVVRRWVRE